MTYNYNKKLLSNARLLRHNMTKEERHIWYDFLSSYPVRFLKQKIIGNYIVDFYCSKAKIVIELDGSQHYEESAVAYDKEREKYLNSQGLKVLRFTNTEILRNFESVCEHIDNAIKMILSSN